MFCFFLMRRRPPRSTRTDTLSPYTTLFRSAFTIFAGDARGDERSYARDLASTPDIPLTEAGYDLAAVDLLRSSFIHAPRPGGRAQLPAYDKLPLELPHPYQAEPSFYGLGAKHRQSYVMGKRG